MQRLLCSIVALSCAMTASAADKVKMPKVLDARYELELVAAEPDIVTPVGIAFDHKGRLLVIESHTHQRPQGYKGPAGDRIRLFEKGKGFSTFFEGETATMSIATRGEDVYIATRMRIFKLRDKDGDGKADEETKIAHLETKGNYPHNGLCGLAFDNQGKLIFGIGENLGEAYKLIGADGKALAGGGEGGNIFRCDADGKNLMRFATGFWNPFGICIDAHGRIFEVDNDADGRPPCRIAHVVGGGDYGYQFRYGRTGTHPLQAWDGELPGTLPMLAGTGEAPCTVVIYHGDLWVTSWGDHRIERYVLQPSGASWKATEQIVIQGDEHFRPTGMAIAPDGSLWFSDWVDRSYPVHGKGRIWRIKPKDGAPKNKPYPDLTPLELRARALEARFDIDALKHNDPFMRQAAIWGLIQHAKPAEIDWSRLLDARQRLAVLQAMRWKEEGADEILPKAFADSDPDVRLAAVRWVADLKLAKYRSQVAEQLERKDGSLKLYQATVAALAWLDRGEIIGGKGGRAEAIFGAIVNDAAKPPVLRAWAMRFLPPQNAALALPKLEAMLKCDAPELRREAVWALTFSEKPERFALLAQLAADREQPFAVRADAVVGLADDAPGQRETLSGLAKDESAAVRAEAQRILRGLVDRKVDVIGRPEPGDIDAWQKRLKGAGDADAGRRAFFSSAGARCASCHSHSGRGNSVGPDLTFIGAQMSDRRLLESILQPAREVAPLYRAFIVDTVDGKRFTAYSVGKIDQGKKERFLTSEGKTVIIDVKEIEAQRPSETSVMPDGLHQFMTDEDLRDIVAFLKRR